MNRHLLLASLLLQRHQQRDAVQPQTRALVGAVPSSVNEQERSIEYTCSTEDLDSYSTILRQNWDLERYRKNPVVLFAHKYDRIPVGRATHVRVENRQLLARVVFATEEECKGAEDVWRAVKNGYMPGISVGFDWRTYRWEKINGVEILVFDDLELRELSLTPVPSNPNALARGVSPRSDPTSAQALVSPDPNLSTLERLRSQRPSSPSPTPAPEVSTMTPEQLKALQDQLRSLESTHAANTREIALLKEQIATGERSLQEARSALAQRDEEIKTRTAKIDLLSAEVERLRASETKAAEGQKAAEERAIKAEDDAARFELRQRMGEDVDPAEVEHLVQMKRAFPEMYQREMAKRDAAPKAGLTRQVLPTGAGTDHRPPAVPEPTPTGKRSLGDVIRSHMPPAPVPAAPPALPAKG